MYIIIGLLVVGGVWYLSQKLKKNDGKEASNNKENSTYIVKQRTSEDDSVLYISKAADFNTQKHAIKVVTFSDNLIVEEFVMGNIFDGRMAEVKRQEMDIFTLLRYLHSAKFLDTVEKFEVSDSHPILSVVDGILYNKEKTILLRCPPNYNANVCIPSTVVEIANFAFRGCSHIKEIILPNSIKTIGIDVFSSCRGLLYMNIPDGVKCISSGLFESCSRLSFVKIPNSVTIIGESAFSRCESLEKVLIPENVAVIPEKAFFDCNKLEKVEFLGELKEIGFRAFANCTSLQSIDLPTGMQSIGEEAFAGCTSLQSIQIPDTVKTIERRAFYNCKLLRSIKIPDSVLSFGVEALDGCHSLLHITAGVGVDFLYPSECFRLKQILDRTWGGIGERKNGIHVYTPKKGKSILSCDAEGFIISKPNAKSKILVDYTGGKTELKIPEGITHIDSYAFYQREIKSVVIPKSVRFISENAFYQCETLEKVVMEGNDGTLEIMSQAFARCYNLQDVSLGQVVSRIGDKAFECCHKLKTLNIPKSVCFIGQRIVSNCKAIEEIIFEDVKGWTFTFDDVLNVEYPQVNAKKLQTTGSMFKK